MIVSILNFIVTYRPVVTKITFTTTSAGSRRRSCSTGCCLPWWLTCADLPRLGTRKLFFLLPRLGEHAPRVGCDYPFGLLAAHGLVIRRHKRCVVTTHTCSPLFRCPNLIEHLTVSRAEQVWASDITYVHLLNGWSYRSLITDLYSHKIVGAYLHPDLSVRGTLVSLQ